MVKSEDERLHFFSEGVPGVAFPRFALISLIPVLMLAAHCQKDVQTIRSVSIVDSAGPGNNAQSGIRTRNLVIPNNLSSELELTGQQNCIQLFVHYSGIEGKDLAIDPGRISDVSQIYCNDKLLSSRGRMHPYESGAFRPQLAILPADLVKPENQIRIHVCSQGDYPIQLMDPIRIGSVQSVINERTIRESVAFAFLAFYFLASLQHLWLGLRRKKERYHLPFSAFLLVVSAYWFVAETYSRDMLFGDEVLWHRKTEYILLFLIVPLFLLFLSRFSTDRTGPVAVAAMGVSLLLSIVALVSNIQIVRICGWIWQFGFLAVSPYLAFLAYRQLLRPFPYSRWLTAAVLILLVSAIHDILVSLSIIHSIRISSYSLAILVVGLILLLGDQLVQATNRSERLLSHATRLNLEMLKKNIQPHFLANSLNSAMELVHEDPHRAERLLLALVEELQSTVELSKQALCPLETEIQLCRNHVEVMSLRMEKSLRLEVYGKTDTEVPPLILLTIVENGITHGFRNRQEGLFRINVHTYEGETFIAIENNGDPTASQETSEHDVRTNKRSRTGGTGTEYVKSRLEELCPGQWQLDQEARPEGFVVFLRYRIPHR